MSALILLSLTTLTGGTTSGSQHYHIVPINSTHLCQHYQAGSCLTLDQLSSQLKQTGDITLSFLPGDHLLTWDMRISGANEVTLNSEQLDNHSHSLPRITCSEGIGIVIKDKQFTMKELEIHGCRRARAGAAISLQRTLAIIQSSTFTNNSAQDFGGALLIEFTEKYIIIESCTFTFNKAFDNGGAISLWSISNATIWNTSFIGNSATGYGYGGAISANDVSLNVSHCSFVNNTAADNGGAVLIRGGRALFENNKFHGNQASRGSALYIFIIFTESTSPSFLTSVTFTNCNVTSNIGNSVLHFYRISANFYGHNFIADNSGSLLSDTSQIFFTDGTQFTNNTSSYGGVIYASSSVITFSESSQTLISNNKASMGGGIYVEHSNLIMNNNRANTAKIAGGGIYAARSTVQVTDPNKKLDISNNVAGKHGGGVYLVESTFNIIGNVMVSSNTARHNGGGMYLSPTSKIKNNNLYEAKMLILRENSAVRGGGVYVEDSDYEARCQGGRESECFVQVDTHALRFLFSMNSATEAGSDIYGGLLDRCIVIFPLGFFNNYKEDSVEGGLQYVQSYMEFDWAQNKLPNSHSERVNTSQFYNHISSDPVRVCFCEDDIIDCNSTHPTVFKKKGEKFTLSLAVTDQVGKPVSATIISKLQTNTTDTGGLKVGQSFREISDQCTTLEYNVYSSHDSVVMELYADGPCSNLGISKQEVNITFLPCTCPVGFERVPPDTNCSCICDKRLISYISNCFTENGTVQIDSKYNVWIEYVNSTNTTDYITQQCPFDYCVQKPVTLSLAHQDEQCAFNRTGTLCGECKEGLSLVFATSNCQQCSNCYLFLILPFALAGIALVAFVLMLNMTVATGTIHGLIFYANILAANRSVFIPSDTPAFLSVFISWLNLDLGIETCFYNGMDSYGKFLLQLVFPAYVFLLIATIMVLCDRSQRIAGLFGKRNPEATLYTLVLLSYSKLIRLIITALQFATISYPDDTQEIAWLYDANVLYFTASHIPRFIAAIMITILGAVYTSLLLFGQLFNHFSEYRLMKWTTHKYYIHFLKAHHAPFSDKRRYWVGLLLLVRLTHYLISAFVSDGIVVLSASSLTLSLLLFKVLIIGKVYRNYWIDSLETLFLVNLFVIVAVTFIISYYYTDGNQTALAIVSMSVTLLAFLALVLYHILHSCGVRLGTVCRRALSSVRQHRHYQLVPINERDEEEDLDDEPLIELGNVENDTDNIVTDPDRYITPPIIRSAVRDDQLREPALDDLIPITPEDYIGI